MAKNANKQVQENDGLMSLASLEDAGFQQCRVDSNFSDITNFVMSKVPTLGDPTLNRSEQMSKDERDRLKVGYVNYYNEKVSPARYFVVADGQYVEKSEEEWLAYQGEKRRLDVHVAFGIDQAGLTYLRENEKVWYGLVQGVKTDFNAYASNKIGELISKAKKIWAKRAGIKRERSLTKVFESREKEALEDLLQKCITADSRGNDPTADVARTKRRIAAYFATA